MRKFLVAILAAIALAAPAAAQQQVTAAKLILSTITGSTQCLHADTNGVVTGTGSDCSGGGGSGTVTSVGTGAGLTGGPVTTAGTISLANSLNLRILANISGSSTAPIGNTFSDIVDAVLTCSAQGDVIFRGFSGWACLAPGTAGQALESGGAGANPTWSTITGTGTVTSVTAGGGLTGGAITTTGTIALSSPVGVANGGTGLTSFNAHSVPVATASTTIVSKVVPNCTDTGGNHLNYTQSTDAFSCGTSGGGGGSGGTTLIECKTASASASLSFDGDVSGTYDDYLLKFSGFRVSSTGDTVRLLVSTVANPTGETSSYDYLGFGRNTSPGAATNISDTSAAFLNLSNGIDSGAGFSFGGQVLLTNLGSTSLKKTYSGEVHYQKNDGASNFEVLTVSGAWQTAGTAATGIIVKASGANFPVGTACFYGYAK